MRRPYLLLLALFLLSATALSCAGPAPSSVPSSDGSLAWRPSTRVIQRDQGRSVRRPPGPPVSPDDPRLVAAAGRPELGLPAIGQGELEIFAINTRERMRVRPLSRDGRLDPSSIADLATILRDHRKDEARRPHPRLVAILYTIAQHYRQPIELVSGYRHPRRARHRTSRHAQSRAADIRVPGVSAAELADFVRSRFESVGVGYYPTSGFVHVDVRANSYYWRDESGPGERQRHRKVPVEPVPPRGSDWTMRFAD